jgi:hypothetical protein
MSAAWLRTAPSTRRAAPGERSGKSRHPLSIDDFASMDLADFRGCESPTQGTVELQGGLDSIRKRLPASGIKS